MKITAIKAQVKRAGRYSIFVDEKYSFSLSESALLDHKLTIGQEVTEEELEEYKRLSAEDKLYNQVLGYLAIRPRSTYEVETYLKRKQASPELQKEILNMLSEKRLLDDRSFAASWVESRRMLKSTSRRRLQLELRQKRVPDQIIREVLTEDETSDEDALRELVLRKRRQTKYQDNLKLMQYLARQGFSYDTIKSVLAETDET